jgi:GTP pyrophosphokinase
MGWLKGELEDLSFPYLYPSEYAWLLTKVKDRFVERQRYLKKVAPKAERLLKKEGVKVLKTDFRAKHYWSLYQKLKHYDNDISKIYDLIALRVIVPDVEQCYAALGAIHKYWPPMVGRVKDYIALPKPNGYQSIHTTVLCEDGQITEFQIRTPEMHEQAEHGISAHWYYSEQKGLKKIFKKIAVKAPEKNLALIKQLRNWQAEIKNLSPDEILSDVKIDFFKSRIFVFTPKGDVIELPEKSTPIDFAYAIHTQVGNTCSLAKINGEAKSLYTELKNGDIVDIQTDKNRKPSADWLNFVKTHHARSSIRKILQGSEKKAIPKLDIFSAILPKKNKVKVFSGKKEVIIEGASGMLSYYAKCCNPKIGDPIVGYITKNKGIAVHTQNCKVFLKAKTADPKKILNAQWK